MRIGVVGCGKSKLEHPAPARDLYTGPLFRLSRRWVEQRCDEWVILSAKHGLVEPGTILVPYETSMGSLSREQRAAWDAGAARALRGRCAGAVEIIFLAGRDYEGATLGLDGVVFPLRGLGIGRRLAWLKRQ